MTTNEEIRELVRDRYAAAARELALVDAGGSADCGCGSTACCTTDHRPVFGSGLYAPEELADLPAEAIAGSLGCGVPTAVADLSPGEIVLDLGSGAGGDVLISARRVGPTGKAYGIDMTADMIALATANAARAGVSNAEFLTGYVEDIPLPDGTVDVVISNCVLNLTADKTTALAEAARVTRTGGRLAVSDVVATESPPPDRSSEADYAGCIVGAITDAEYRAALAAAGWVDVQIERTHDVAATAYAAIVRATRG